MSRQRAERVVQWRQQFNKEEQEEGEKTEEKQQKPTKSSPSQLFIGGLPKVGDMDEIKSEIIQGLGDIADSVNLILDKKTGKMKVRNCLVLSSSSTNHTRAMHLWNWLPLLCLLLLLYPNLILSPLVISLMLVEPDQVKC